MAKRFRVPFFIRAGNTLTTLLLRRGVKMGNNTLLTVPGRKSGLPRTTPITIIEYEGRRYIQSPFGEVDWVRNLRAAASATLTHGSQSETVTAIELSAEEAAPVLRQGFTIAPAVIRSYFDFDLDSPLEAVVRDAARHPTFELVTSPSALTGSRPGATQRRLSGCGVSVQE